MDTVRADRIAGYGEADTPHLRAIAREGVLFRRFYAASTYTLPATMSLLTGLPPTEHGVVNMPSRLGPELSTLAQRLREVGYRTHAFHEGGFVAASYGFDRGFEAYEERKLKQLVGASLWTVLDWMREAGDEPYFLFLHSYAAHYPYGSYERYRSEHPERGLPSLSEVEQLRLQYNDRGPRFYPASRGIPVELRRVCTVYNSLAQDLSDYLECGDRMLVDDFIAGPHFEMDVAAMRKGYDEWIHRFDRALGEIRKTLVELGQWEDTLLVITSDHGEAFFEHGLQMHDYVPFDEVLKVPLIVSYPRQVPGGRVIEGLAWHLDVVPTILSLAKAEIPPNLRGLDLSGVLRQEEAISAERAIFPLLLRPADRPHLPPRGIVLQGDLKYIEGHEALGDAEGLLFDLGESPDEQENLRSSRPDRVRDLTQLLEAHRSSLSPGAPVHQKTGRPISPVPGAVEPFEIDDGFKQKLQALGYLL